MNTPDKRTFVGTGEVGKLQGEFAERGVKLLALSCNDVDSHKGYELSNPYSNKIMNVSTCQRSSCHGM